MTVASPGELLRSLEAADYDAVLGTRESDELDFKEQPYQLGHDYGKWELCKDVAALANANGGCLVIGYAVKRDPEDIAEVASKSRPVPSKSIKPAQYKKVLASGVYPAPSFILHSFTRGLPQGQLVFAIEVRPDKNREPFIVRRMPDPKGKVSGEAVGIPSRFHDDTRWETAEEIYQRIQAAPMERRPRRVEPDERHQPVNQEAFERRAKGRSAEMGALESWASEPLYALHAAPATTGHELDDLHDPSGLGGKLQRPNGLRSSGFGLPTGTSDVINGAFVSRSRMGPIVWLESGGFFSLAARGSRSYLGWAVNDGVFPERPWTLINSLVLVELTLEFFRFVHGELQPRIGGAWFYGVQCSGFQKAKLRLASGWSRSLIGLWDEDTKAASSDAWWQAFVDKKGRPPGDNAFRALKQVYKLFGLPPSAIPFQSASIVSEEILIREASKPDR